MRSRRIILLLAVLSAAIAFSMPTPANSFAPGDGEPRITLSLKRATLASSAGALERASGLRIDPTAALRTEPGLAAEVRDFTWADRSLDEALRELCASFHCNCFGQETGYGLYAAAQIRKSPAQFSQNGITVKVAEVVRTELRAASLAAGGAAPPLTSDQGRVALGLMVDLDARRRSWDLGVRNLRARDEFGAALTDTESPSSLKTFPGQRVIQAFLSLSRRDSARLDTIEGELTLTPPRAFTQIELPFPKARTTEQKALSSGEAVAASDLRPADLTPGVALPKDVGGAPPSLLSPPLWYNERGPSVLFRAERPWTGGGNMPSPPDVSAVGASGRFYAGHPAANAFLGGRSMLYSGRISFEGATEPLEKPLCRFPQREPAGETLAFRLTNVPIPTLIDLPVQQFWKIPTQEEPNAPNLDVIPPPFFTDGGAVLQFRVRLLGHPAALGRLQLGLSRREAGNWTIPRWCVGDVDGGRCRLQGLAAGHYRLLRRYQLDGLIASGPGWQPGATPAGTWLNSFAEVDVPAAGVVSAPPLELVASPTPGRAESLPNTGSPPAPGIRWSAVSVRQSLARASGFEGSMLLRAYEDAELALATKLETPAAGQDEIRYFQSAWALDDRGTLLTADFRPPWFTGPTDPLLFSAPHPLATELRWVEGELMTLPNRRNVRIEMRFPQPGSAAIHREGDDVLLGLSVDQQPIPSAPVPPLIKAPLPPEDTHPHLRIRFAFRNMALESVPMGVHSVPLPRGIGKSGASYVGSSSGTSFYHIRNWVEHVQDVTFPGAGEPLSRLVWEIPVRDSPHSLGVVRMERVRLPRPTTMPRVIEKAAGPGVVPPPADGNAAPPVPRTGTLIIPAPLVGLPTPGHGVAVGLSQRSAPGWGPVRWEDAPVDSSGRGVLRNVKPGRYRILIRSKPQGAAVEVVIQSGHETVLPTARTK